MLHQITRVIKEPLTEDCSICMCSLNEESGYVDDNSNGNFFFKI